MQVEPLDAYVPFLVEWSRTFGLLVANGSSQMLVGPARERANADEQAMLSECVGQLARVRRVRAWLEG